MFCYADSHEIVAVLTFQIDPENPEAFIMENHGNHPDVPSWQQIERASIGDEHDIDPAEDLTLHEWIQQHYDTDELLAISPDP